MTEKEINTLIAKTCGWVPKIIGWKIAESETSIPAAINFISAFEAQEYLDRARRNTEDYDRKLRVFPVWEACPDYCNDLNAMHEAEKWLTELNWFTYISELAQIVRFPKQPEVQLRQSIHATARQRAEAFLQTLGKWEEVQA